MSLARVASSRTTWFVRAGACFVHTAMLCMQKLTKPGGGATGVPSAMVVALAAANVIVGGSADCRGRSAHAERDVRTMATAQSLPGCIDVPLDGGTIGTCQFRPR